MAPQRLSRTLFSSSMPPEYIDPVPVTRLAEGVVAKDEDALHTLLTAEQKSPGIVRHSAVVREVVRSMYRRAPASAGKKSSPLPALAERCRAVT